MRVRFWGVRGSIPSPGPRTVRYGGNTPCVEIRFADDSLLILDAGTGIRALGDSLVASGLPVTACIAITHPHWDHIQGLPFFRPLFTPGNRFIIAGPETQQFSLRRVLSDVMNDTYFPVKLDDVQSDVSFRRLEEETMDFGAGRIRSGYVNHPYKTLGYRIEEAGKDVAYVTDNEPMGMAPSALEPAVNERISSAGHHDEYLVSFVRGVDLLIHDATFRPEEMERHRGWGHSDYQFALDLAAKADVNRLILFHHHQNRSDEEIDRTVEACRQEIEQKGYRFRCEAAFEGMVAEV